MARGAALAIILAGHAAVAIAVALIAGGCGFSAGFDGTRYRCNDSFRCPDGQLCVQGYCEQLEEVPIDGGGIDGGGEPDEVCVGGDLEARDEFDTLDGEVWLTWANGDAQAFVSDGELVVSSAVDSNAGIIASEPQDLDRLMVSVEVGARSSGGEGTLASLQLMDTGAGDSVLVLERTHDQLRAMAYLLGAAEELGTIDHDAEEQRFWRIITTDDAASFEYSSDETDWNVLATRSILDLPEEVKPQLQSGSYGEVGQVQSFDLFTVCRL